jgi:ATP-dependent helicase HrpB
MLRVPMPPAVLPLPIDAYLPELVAKLQAGNLVLTAEPGAGKTTRLPRALLDSALGRAGKVLVLEPRRIAARMAARRVADELGEAVGERIGYQVRFDERVSARTRVSFVTEGLLTRRLLAEPELPGVSVVLLDEFHERHLQGDLALSLLRRLQQRSRPELRIGVMSATLHGEPVARFLDAASVAVPGRVFPVHVEFAEAKDDRHLDKRVAGAFRGLCDAGLDGDVLVFLPGAAEIRRAREACEALCTRQDIELHMLHGDLPAEAQDAAVQPGRKRKLVLSTNLAESSLTLPAVTAVIDSGLERRAAHSPFSGLPTLSTVPISRASAEQRAGRAGRVREGRCIRLYTKHDFQGWLAHGLPEVARADLSESVLALAALDAELGPEAWFEPPPAPAYAAARTLLERLDALDPAGRITPLGRLLLEQPLHPRLGRLLIEACRRGVPDDGALLAALLGERDVSLAARARFSDQKRDVLSGPSDLLHRLETFDAVERGGFRASDARAFDADLGALKTVARVRDRLLRRLPPVSTEPPEHFETALGMSVLAAFPDRVARRRSPGSDQLVFSSGSATQADSSVVRDAELVVVVEASESLGKGRGVQARLVSAIEPEWLLELFESRVVDRHELSFEASAERMQERHVLSYDGLVLEETRRPAGAGPEVQAALAEAVQQQGLGRVWDLSALDRLSQRLAVARRVEPRLPALDAAGLAALVLRACEGNNDFAGLRKLALEDLFVAELGADLSQALARHAPEALDLPSGRRLEVHYERDRPPWVESYLQDFFGLGDGPRLGGEPVVLHLLAPNRRAVQVSTDLSGFWERHYPEQRRALMRRYPRHSWPDDPRSAAPPPPRNRGRKA